jgi:hypothetical protein
MLCLHARLFTDISTTCRMYFGFGSMHQMFGSAGYTVARNLVVRLWSVEKNVVTRGSFSVRKELAYATNGLLFRDGRGTF